MGKIKWVKSTLQSTWPIVRNTAIGGIAGGVAGRLVSTANDAPAGQKRGIEAGAIAGAIIGLPFGKLLRGAQIFGRTFSRGLKAKNPASKTAIVMQGLDKTAVRGKLVFRRIRGRIVPIREK
jgi:outer membrane lipoprotein SlyB